MNARIKFAAPLVLAAAGAIAATGFTSRTTETTTAAPPANDIAIAPAESAAPAPMAVEDSASAPAVRETAIVPAQHRARVMIEAPRPSDDELLRNLVMDRISSDGRISGTVGVESYRHTVSLTGRVMSTNQVDRAEMIARGVDGVRDVNNELRARVGQS